MKHTNRKTLETPTLWLFIIRSCGLGLLTPAELQHHMHCSTIPNPGFFKSGCVNKLPSCVDEPDLITGYPFTLVDAPYQHGNRGVLGRKKVDSFAGEALVFGCRLNITTQRWGTAGSPRMKFRAVPRDDVSIID